MTYTAYPSVTITHNGVDVTTKVISYSRDKDLCNFTGECAVVFDIDCGISFSIWDRILIRDVSATGTDGYYFVNTISKDQKQITISCQDGSKLLQDYFIDTPYTSYLGQTTKTLLEYFLDLAGVTYSFDASVGLGELVQPYTSYGMTSAMTTVASLLQQSSWYAYFDGNNVMQIFELTQDETNSAGTINGNEILAMKIVTSDKMFRNRVVVWGGGDPDTGDYIYADVGLTSEHQIDAKDIRTVVVQNGNIDSSADAVEIATDVLNVLGKINDEVNIECTFRSEDTDLRGVDLAKVFTINSTKLQYTGIITEIEVEYGIGGLIIKLNLGRKCPKIFGYYNYTVASSGTVFPYSFYCGYTQMVDPSITIVPGTSNLRYPVFYEQDGGVKTVPEFTTLSGYVVELDGKTITPTREFAPNADPNITDVLVLNDAVYFTSEADINEDGDYITYLCKWELGTDTVATVLLPPETYNPLNFFIPSISGVMYTRAILVANTTIGAILRIDFENDSYTEIVQDSHLADTIAYTFINYGTGVGLNDTAVTFTKDADAGSTIRMESVQFLCETETLVDLGIVFAHLDDRIYWPEIMDYVPAEFTAWDEGYSLGHYTYTPTLVASSSLQDTTAGVYHNVFGLTTAQAAYYINPDLSTLEDLAVSRETITSLIDANTGDKLYINPNQDYESCSIFGGILPNVDSFVSAGERIYQAEFRKFNPYPSNYYHSTIFAYNAMDISVQSATANTRSTTQVDNVAFIVFSDNKSFYFTNTGTTTDPIFHIYDTDTNTDIVTISDMPRLSYIGPSLRLDSDNNFYYYDGVAKKIIKRLYSEGYATQHEITGTLDVATETRYDLILLPEYLVLTVYHLSSIVDVRVFKRL